MPSWGKAGKSPLNQYLGIVEVVCYELLEDVSKMKFIHFGASVHCDGAGPGGVDQRKIGTIGNAGDGTGSGDYNGSSMDWDQAEVEN